MIYGNLKIIDGNVAEYNDFPIFQLSHEKKLLPAWKVQKPKRTNHSYRQTADYGTFVSGQCRTG